MRSRCNWEGCQTEEALILAEGRYLSSDGKTAHGLVRKSLRYKIVGVIDSELAGRDAGEVLDGVHRGIRIYRDLDEALRENPSAGNLIVGVATSGGRLPPSYREIIKAALERGLNVISGLHEFLSEDPEFSEIARRMGVKIIDVRKMYQGMKIFYSGKIRDVKALKVVVLGTDSCIGKRTTAWMLVDELNKIGVKSTFVGTGQTAWMQGAKYGIVLDAMINDFIPGGLEHEIWRAYSEEKPDVIVVPGQGSLLHPVFPGSYEILNLLSPEVVILQHAPGRRHLEDFPEYPLPPLQKYLKIIELINGRVPLAITINTEGMSEGEVRSYIKKTKHTFGIPVFAPLVHGMEPVAKLIKAVLRGDRL